MDRVRTTGREGGTDGVSETSGRRKVDVRDRHADQEKKRQNIRDQSCRVCLRVVLLPSLIN